MYICTMDHFRFKEAIFQPIPLTSNLTNKFKFKNYLLTIS